MLDRRRPTGTWAVRSVLLLAMVVVAGTMLFVLPEPDGDPVAEVYALQADGDPDAPTTDQRAENESPASTDEVSGETGARPSQGWLAALSGSEAAANLNVAASLARRTTTAPPTTEVTTTSTRQTTTEPPTTTAAQTTADTDASTAAETTESTEGAETTEESAPSAESSESADTTEATGQEMTTTTAPTTTAPPTTAPDNGFVNAGHGVYVPPILLKIRWCESNDNYTAANPSSSARGAYQFLTGSWSAYGHAARYGVSQAHLATPAQQDEAALITWQRDGTRPWLASKHCWA